jgi:sulfatase modifying factor 1
VKSTTGTNNANYYNNGYTDPTYHLTSVGYFAGSPSAYQTFDQGGNVFQWNDTIIYGSFRGLRGGSWVSSDYHLQSGYRYHDDPTDESYSFGFRVSQVPEPAFLGVLCLGAIGMFRRRRGIRR